MRLFSGLLSRIYGDKAKSVKQEAEPMLPVSPPLPAAVKRDHINLHPHLVIQIATAGPVPPAKGLMTMDRAIEEITGEKITDRAAFERLADKAAEHIVGLYPMLQNAAFPYEKLWALYGEKDATPAATATSTEKMTGDWYDKIAQDCGFSGADGVSVTKIRQPTPKSSAQAAASP